MKRSLSLITAVLASIAMASQTADLPKELKTLDYFAGRWATESTTKDGPSCAYTGEWVLGKRHLRMEVNGTLMGMKFEGMMLLTFDESRGKYASTWADSLGGMVATGYGDWKGDTLTTTTEMLEMGGQKMRIRATLTKKSPEKWVYDVSGGDGDKWQSFMNLMYVKQK